MREHTHELRDHVVRGLARLSLVAVLALMGALFIGSAAVGSPDGTSAAAEQSAEPRQEGLFEKADPIGVLLGAAVLGGGLGVLMVGAFKPERRNSRELAELLSR